MKTLYKRILEAIDDLGPLTMREMAEQVGLTAEAMRCRLGRIRVGHPKGLRIVSYERNEEGGRLYPRARYGRGPGPDAKRPPPLTRSEYNRRHVEVKKCRVNSVFGLAVPYDKRRVTRSRSSG